MLTATSNKQSRVQSLLNDLLAENRRNEINNSNKLDEIRKEILMAIDQTDSRQAARSEDAFANIGTGCLELAREGEKLDKSQRILRSLNFKYIKMREEAIKEAHAETFEWIFNETDIGTERRPRFSHWLREGEGIYWVSGKAGSGKSTLMKLLCGHERTKNALEIWAGRKKLLMGSFFFWNAGSTMQKSQHGLLQSILYQILGQCPDLIPTVCSSRWYFNAADHELDGIWSRQELFENFRRLAHQEFLSARFCFFIDGLDEYDGEDTEIIKLLQDLTISSSVKICASSRQWNAFEKAFGGNVDQKLRLQDFTKNDIRLYATGKLEEDASFSRKKSEDIRYNQLIDDIVQKSSGVFLWVYLVVRSLLRGLTDDNDFAFMRKRLDHFPADLEDYFKQMLNTIEDVYRDQAARIFQVMVHSKSQLTPLSFYYLEKEQDDPNYALDRDMERLTNEESFKISEKMQPYLNACCKDLLEVIPRPKYKGENHPSSGGVSVLIAEQQIDRGTRLSNVFEKSQVCYMVDWFQFCSEYYRNFVLNDNNAATNDIRV